MLGRKRFYGYFNSAFAGIAVLLVGGSHYMLPALAGFMQKDLGWGAGPYGAAFSVYHVVFGLVTAVAGALAVRFGPRSLIVAGAAVLVAACLLLSLVRELWQFYLIVAIYGAATAGGAVVTGPQLASNWLRKRRGMVIGLLLAATALGGSLLTLVAERVMTAAGSWRISWLVVAGIMLIAVVVTLGLVRNRPEDLGQRMDGIGTSSSAQRSRGGQKKQVYKSLDPWTVREALQTATLWMLVLVFGICNFAYLGTLPHTVSYLTGEVGVSAEAAAGALALMVAFMAVGKAGGGWLADRVEPRMTRGLSSLAMALGLSLLIFWHAVPALYVYVVLFGFGFGGCQSQTVASFANYFGPKHMAAILGVTMGLAALLGALGTWVTGFIRDQTGSYVTAFVVMMILSVAGAVCAFFTPLPRYPRKTDSSQFGSWEKEEGNLA
jgi:MFS family permease